MRILHVCNSDLTGGAAIAAHRLVVAQRDAGMDAQMLVLRKTGSDSFVHRAPLRTRATARLARTAAKRWARLKAFNDPEAMRTLAVIPTGLPSVIVALKPDIVHWHWVGAETLSLSEMASIRVPSVWTCHDEWAWCGAEHSATNDRFREGYLGKDIDARTFRRKIEQWTDFTPTLVLPSQCTATRCKESFLMGDVTFEVIPNTLDFEKFVVKDKTVSRARLGITPDKHVILFGAVRGTNNPYKGFDLLSQSLEHLAGDSNPSISLLIFGGNKGDQGRVANIAYRELGHLDGEQDLATAYSAADVFVSPSRHETFGNTILEAIACGTPCVAFDVGGAPELLWDDWIGDVIAPYDVGAFAIAMRRWLTSASSEEIRNLRHISVRERFGPAGIARRHLDLYRKMLKQDNASAVA